MDLVYKINVAAERMFNYYFNNYYKYKYPRRAKTMHEKFIPQFKKVAEMFATREDFDPKTFIKVAMNDKFRYPAELASEALWNTYKVQHRSFEAEETIEEQQLQIVQGIVQCAEEIKNYKGIENFFKSFIIQNKIKNNCLNYIPWLLAFSKTFIRFFHSNDLDYYNLEILREKIYRLPKKKQILKTIMDFLGEDYFMFEKVQELRNMEEELMKNNFIF